jgi:hypothetical protein
LASSQVALGMIDDAQMVLNELYSLMQIGGADDALYY